MKKPATLNAEINSFDYNQALSRLISSIGPLLFLLLILFATLPLFQHITNLSLNLIQLLILSSRLSYLSSSFFSLQLEFLARNQPSIMSPSPLDSPLYSLFSPLYSLFSHASLSLSVFNAAASDSFFSIILPIYTHQSTIQLFTYHAPKGISSIFQLLQGKKCHFLAF